jgi:hypothetical protein
MTTPSRRNVAWPLVAVYALLLSVAWILASPVGASPDEEAHVAYAWGTVTGQTIFNERLMTMPAGQMATAVQIPNKLLQAPNSVCYRFRAGTPTVSCTKLPADNGQVSTHATYMSRYPPLFYAAEGAVMRAATAVSLSGSRVLYSARLAAAALTLFALGFGVLLLSRRFPARTVLLVALLAIPATAWFLTSSVNPNGLEISAAFLLAAAVLSVRVDDAAGARSRAAVLAVPLGTLLLAWSRPLSWVWASLILALLLVPAVRRDGESWIRRLPVRRLGVVALSTTVLILVSSMVWFAYALQVRTSEKLGKTDLSFTALSPIGRVVVLVLHTGTILFEQIGMFGWLDTPLPSLAILCWVAVAGVAVAVWIVGRSTLVPRWSMGVILGLGYLAALLDEYLGHWGWQGRYLLPVTAALVVFAVPGLVNGFERLAPLTRVVPAMMVVLMAVNSLAVVWFLFRNSYGVKGYPARLPSVPLPVGTPKWVPPFGLGLVLALVAVAFACGVVAVWKLRPLAVNEELESSDSGQQERPLDQDPSTTVAPGRTVSSPEQL